MRQKLRAETVESASDVAKTSSLPQMICYRPSEAFYADGF
jgi:hypothetical protein